MRMEAGMTMRLIAGALAAALCTLAAAQTVYESKDKSGATVFSDKPTPGSKPMDLPPPNVVTMPPLPKRGPAPAPVFAYQSLAVATPEEQGTVHSNTGGFEVRIKISPALRVKTGDRIRLKLDGNLLPASYSSGEIALTDADWQTSATSTSGDHTLQVSFYARRATVRRSTR
jgi:Domain of unknown function (DUF4124)